MNPSLSVTSWPRRYIALGLLMLAFVLTSTVVHAQSHSLKQPMTALQRAKIYLAAGDYRRAILACQQYIDLAPSVEGYVYLTYVYHAMDGYLSHLAKNDEWVKVGQFVLGLYTRGTLDILDPPDPMARMAKEMIQEGLRQQFDLTAAMANRLDHERVNQLWTEQTAWEKSHPDTWWSGVPRQWSW